MRMVQRGDKWNKNRELLVCTMCKTAIFVDSAVHKAPRWTGEAGDPPSKRKRIDGQDNLSVFKKEHTMHEMIEVELVSYSQWSLIQFFKLFSNL